MASIHESILAGTEHTAEFPLDNPFAGQQCPHDKQSGALWYGSNGRLEAGLKCDQCGTKLRSLPGPTLEANDPEAFRHGGGAGPQRTDPLHTQQPDPQVRQQYTDLQNRQQRL